MPKWHDCVRDLAWLIMAVNAGPAHRTLVVSPGSSSARDFCGDKSHPSLSLAETDRGKE